MKRSHWFALLMACLTLLLFAGTESAQVQPFDVKKCRRELEIMRGILRTTLGFASKELAASTKISDADSKNALPCLWAVANFRTSAHSIWLVRVRSLRFPLRVFASHCAFAKI